MNSYFSQKFDEEPVQDCLKLKTNKDFVDGLLVRHKGKNFFQCGICGSIKTDAKELARTLYNISDIACGSEDDEFLEAFGWECDDLLHQIIVVGMPKECYEDSDFYAEWLIQNEERLLPELNGYEYTEVCIKCHDVVLKVDDKCEFCEKWMRDDHKILSDLSHCAREALTGDPQMKTDLIKKQTPEEKELAKKLKEIADLEVILAQRELDLTTFKVELHTFERQYIHIVGVLYAELDEIEAKIAEAKAKSNPDNETVQEEATQARERAFGSSQAVGDDIKEIKIKDFKPSDSLKKLYREIAKRLHPDLCLNEKDRARRQKFMAEANLAYEKGDEERLRAILNEWENSPESIEGEGTGAELIRVIRKIAQAQERLKAIELEIESLKNSDLFQLKQKVEETEDQGRDLLNEMAIQVKELIFKAQNRLDNMVKGNA